MQDEKNYRRMNRGRRAVKLRERMERDERASDPLHHRTKSWAYAIRNGLLLGTPSRKSDTAFNQRATTKTPTFPPKPSPPTCFFSGMIRTLPLCPTRCFLATHEAERPPREEVAGVGPREPEACRREHEEGVPRPQHFVRRWTPAVSIP